LITRIYIGSQRLDLYDDESIDINSSINDASDISKTTTDYSKSFTVPASKTNNKLFKHYYNANIENSFDARTKIEGRVELYNVPYKIGKFRLLKVNVKKGNPESYTVNFVGNLVDIKKKVGKELLSEIDLSAFNHDFNGANIKTGLATSLFAGDVIYTLNPKKQYYYNSSATDNGDTTTITNIADNGGTEVHGVRFGDLSPSLKAIRILEAVEARYSLTFSRDFFGTSSFTDLYQTITNKKESIAGGTQILDWDGGDDTNVSFATDTGSFFARATTDTGDNLNWRLYLTVVPASGYGNVQYTLKTIVDDSERANEAGIGTQQFGDTLSVNGEATFEVRYEITASEEFKYTANWVQRRMVPSTNTSTYYLTSASENTLNSTFVASENLPKIKVIDWLTGLFKAFKLVIIPQDDGTFYVDTLNRYYAKGIIYDVTKYIDFESYDVERGELFSDINFNFEDPETILNQEFTKNTGTAYGDEEVKLTDALGDPLDGGTYDIKVPFETVVYDRISNLNNDDRTNIMYAPFLDESGTANFPKTNFFYNIAQNITTTPIRYITNNNVLETITGNINTAFHATDIQGSSDAFIFSSEFSEWNGQAITSNLYTNFHKRYIDGIFSVKRRNYKFSAVLPMQIATKLELKDVLKIKGNYYRIDNYTTNVNTGKSNLVLINAFADSLSELVDGGTTKYAGYAETTDTIRTNSALPVVVLSDTGFGTSWASYVIVGDNVNVTATKNDTGNERSIIINLTDGDGNRTETDVLFIQEDGNLTVDNNSVTVDNDQITADNG
jgi:hypothetical protein